MENQEKSRNQNKKDFELNFAEESPKHAKLIPAKIYFSKKSPN